MHVSAWNVALQSINFLVLAWLLQRFLFKPVRAVLAKREETIATSLRDGDAKRIEAEQALAEYRAKSEGLAREALQARELALAEAEKDARRLREEAARVARVESERAKAEVERERGLVLNALESQAADLAIKIANRLLHDVAPETDALFLWRATESVDALDAVRKAAFARQVTERGIEVVSAHALDAATRERFERWLSSIAMPHAGASYAVDPSLIAGVELRLPYAVWRSHWRASLEQIRAELVSHDAAA